MSNGLKIAAVGPVTAEKLAQMGVRVDVVPNKFTGVQLAHGLGDLGGKRVLLPRARKGRPEMATALREQGANVEDIATYDTVAATPPAEALAELERGLDAITFASPSSVRYFLEAIAPLDFRPDETAAIACIGPTTAAEAESLGLRVDVIPEAYTIGGLIEALESYFKEKGL